MSEKTKTQRTIAEFIKDNGITMFATKLKRRPEFEQHDAWAKDASHWQVVFSRGSQELSTYYSMGSAHKGKPKIEDVLDCLVSDASGVENSRRFEDWADELGYDTDSRRAERIYNACVKIADEMREFLGNREYHILLNNIERL